MPIATLAVLLVATLFASPAAAAVCPPAKLQATGKRAAAELACRAKAVAKGVAAADQSCLAKAAARFDAAFARAESKGDCAATGDAGAIAAEVGDAVTAIATALGGPGPSVCTSKKLQAAGKKAAAKFGCLAKAAKKRGQGVNAKCLLRAETKHVQAFVKAEAKGDCLAPAGDEPAIEGLVDTLLQGSRATLAPPRSTCAPVTPTALHGENFFGNTRLARIEKGKVPCIHAEDLKVTRCAFSIVPGSESGAWLESPAGSFARVGQGINKDGTPNGPYTIAADVRKGPAACVDGAGLDTMGYITPGEELAATCTLEDMLQSYDVGTAFDPDYVFANVADAIVCSADAVHPNSTAEPRGDGGFGAGVYCWTGLGAAINDINGTERDIYTNYIPGERHCHYVVSGGYEVPGAKRPATRSLPAPGSINVKTTIVWRPVSNVPIANFVPAGSVPTPTPTSTSGTPTVTPTPTPTLTVTATPTPPPAADYVVDTTLDDPALSACTGATPDCSLRGALAAAAAAGQHRTITVPAGTYELTATAACSYETRQFGDVVLPPVTSLCIPGNVTLLGAGAAITIIDGKDTDRVLLVGDGGPVYVEGVTIRSGQQTGSAPFGGGGAINAAGDLMLSDCVVTDSSSAAAGGAIYNSGTLAVRRCTFTGNIASTGGAIYTDSFNLPVETTILESTLAGNHATTEHGGGLFISGFDGATTVRDTTISGNDAATAGGGVGLGGLSNTLVIVNSTISGNHAKWCCGGGIWDGGASDVTLRNVTVTGNRSESPDGLTGGGGGISRNASGTFTLTDTIVAGNSAANYGPDCYDGAATFTSEGYNLIGTQGGANVGGTDCDFAGGLGAGDTVGEDPLLGTLGDNGGPTETHLPTAGSPAIDTGNPAGCTDENGAVLITDQRGKQRTVDGDGDTVPRCDRGAVEASGN